MKPILEHIPLGQEQSIAAFRYEKADFDMPWHFHPQHELTYIEASFGTKFIGDYVGSYEPGELVLLRSNLPHCWKNQVSQEGLSISTVVQWNPGIFAKVPELEALHDMLKLASKGIMFDREVSLSMRETILQFPQLSPSDLYLQLLGLLLHLSQYSYTTLSEIRFTDDLPSEYSSRMGSIHDFVAENYDRKIYLREVADVVSMSEQAFSRFFSKMMGRPFFTFLNEYRINVAGRMLIDTDWPVAQIGYACGYESLPFFYQQFKKFLEVSPLTYRRKYAA